MAFFERGDLAESADAEPGLRAPHVGANAVVQVERGRVEFEFDEHERPNAQSRAGRDVAGTKSSRHSVSTNEKSPHRFQCRLLKPLHTTADRTMPRLARPGHGRPRPTQIAFYYVATSSIAVNDTE